MHYWPFFVILNISGLTVRLICAWAVISPCIFSFESWGHAFSSCLVVYVGGASFWTGSSLWVLPGPLEGSRLQYVFSATISPVLRWRCLADWTCTWNVLLAPTWEGGGHRRVKSCSMRLLDQTSFQTWGSSCFCFKLSQLQNGLLKTEQSKRQLQH